MIPLLLPSLLQAEVRSVPSLRPSYPSNGIAIDSGALGRDDFVALVTLVRRDEGVSRTALSGNLPSRWDLDTFRMVSASASTPPREIRVLVPSPDAGESLTQKLSRPGTHLINGLVSSPSQSLAPMPGARFLLAARQSQDGRFRLSSRCTRWRGELRPSAPDELVGSLLLRTEARAIDSDPDASHAFLKTLLEGLPGGDEECLRQATQAVLNARGLSMDGDWTSWFAKTCRPLIRVEADRRRGYERLLLESAWQVRLDATPWSSEAIVDALGDVADSGRQLDEEDRALIGNIHIGQIGTSFSRALAVERRTSQDWVRAMLVRALPRPRDAGEYRSALRLGDDPSDRVVGAVAERLAEWGGRPDLRPVTIGMTRTPRSAELRGLVSSWRKVSFEQLGRTEGVIPKRIRD